MEDVSSRWQLDVGSQLIRCSSQSTALNSSRLKVLQARNDHLEQLFEDAGKDVKELASGDKYAKALEAFILEVSFDLISLHSDVSPASQAKDVFIVSKGSY